MIDMYTSIIPRKKANDAIIGIAVNNISGNTININGINVKNIGKKTNGNRKGTILIV